MLDTSCEQTIESMQRLIFNIDNLNTQCYHQIKIVFNMFKHAELFNLTKLYVDASMRYKKERKTYNDAYVAQRKAEGKSEEEYENACNYTLQCFGLLASDEDAVYIALMNLNEWLKSHGENTINNIQDIYDFKLLSKYIVFEEPEDEKHFNYAVDALYNLNSKIDNKDDKTFKQIKSNIMLQNVLITFRQIPGYVETYLKYFIESLTEDEQKLILTQIQKPTEQVKKLIWNNEFGMFPRNPNLTSFYNEYDEFIERLSMIDEISNNDDEEEEIADF